LIGYGWLAMPSTSPLFAPLSATSVTTHHTQTDPEKRTENGCDDRVQPQWPREVPSQEVKPDLGGVLDDEDEQQAASGE
jgi:hypothetical protein